MGQDNIPQFPHLRNSNGCWGYFFRCSRSTADSILSGHNPVWFGIDPDRYLHKWNLVDPEQGLDNSAESGGICQSKLLWQWLKVGSYIAALCFGDYFTYYRKPTLLLSLSSQKGGSVVEGLVRFEGWLQEEERLPPG